MRGLLQTAEEHQYLCENCHSRAPRITPPFCAKCSEQFFGAISQEFECANCKGRILHFDAAVSAYRSRGLVRELVHQFKYGRQRHLRHPLAAWLAETMSDPRLLGRRFDCIVPVPLHPARERERGFNQATLLAELLAARIAVPLRPVLDRIRYTTTQTAYDRAERMENLHDAFRLRKNADVRELQRAFDRRCVNNRLDPERMRARAQSGRCGFSSCGHRRARLGHGYFQKTSAQSAKPEETRDAARPLAKMSGLL